MIRRTAEAGGTISEAVYSDCLTYRYELTRIWNPAAPRLLYILLNPSTADETRNDPTVERCQRRAEVLGFGGFRVCNLFAFRATDPADLKRAADPVGPENDAALTASLAWAAQTLCGWGVHGTHAGRAATVTALLTQTGAPLHSLGQTREGHPRHPLYVGYATRPAPWQPAQEIGASADFC